MMGTHSSGINNERTIIIQTLVTDLTKKGYKYSGRTGKQQHMNGAMCVFAGAEVRACKRPKTSPYIVGRGRGRSMI